MEYFDLQAFIIPGAFHDADHEPGTDGVETNEEVKLRFIALVSCLAIFSSLFAFDKVWFLAALMLIVGAAKGVSSLQAHNDQFRTRSSSVTHLPTVSCPEVQLQSTDGCSDFWQLKVPAGLLTPEVVHTFIATTTKSAENPDVKPEDEAVSESHVEPATIIEPNVNFDGQTDTEIVGDFAFEPAVETEPVVEIESAAANEPAVKSTDQTNAEAAANSSIEPVIEADVDAKSFDHTDADIVSDFAIASTTEFKPVIESFSQTIAEFTQVTNSVNVSNINEVIIEASRTANVQNTVPPNTSSIDDDAETSLFVQAAAEKIHVNLPAAEASPEAGVAGPDAFQCSPEHIDERAEASLFEESSPQPVRVSLPLPTEQTVKQHTETELTPFEESSEAHSLGKLSKLASIFDDDADDDDEFPREWSTLPQIEEQLAPATVSEHEQDDDEQDEVEALKGWAGHVGQLPHPLMPTIIEDEEDADAIFEEEVDPDEDSAEVCTPMGSPLERPMGSGLAKLLEYDSDEAFETQRRSGGMSEIPELDEDHLSKADKDEEEGVQHTERTTAEPVTAGHASPSSSAPKSPTSAPASYGSGSTTPPSFPALSPPASPLISQFDGSNTKSHPFSFAQSPPSRCIPPSIRAPSPEIFQFGSLADKATAFSFSAGRATSTFFFESEDSAKPAGVKFTGDFFHIDVPATVIEPVVAAERDTKRSKPVPPKALHAESPDETFKVPFVIRPPVAQLEAATNKNGDGKQKRSDKKRKPKTKEQMKAKSKAGRKKKKVAAKATAVAKALSDQSRSKYGLGARCVDGFGRLPIEP